MSNKTYKHFIDGVHVATYKQPTNQDVQRAQRIQDIKTAATTILGVITMLLLAYAFLLVA